MSIPKRPANTRSSGAKAPTRRPSRARQARKPPVPLADTKVILFNKPFQVMSQFSEAGEKRVLAEFIAEKDVYPAGRLDYDSEGLLILTNNGQVQAKIAEPRFKLPKTYWAQVEGEISDEAVAQLRDGVELKDGMTAPAAAAAIDAPDLWARVPPIRERANIPTSWVELTISEGRNRQVRRMTAAVGFPTLRLVRAAIGPWSIDRLGEPGQWVTLSSAEIENFMKR